MKTEFSIYSKLLVTITSTIHHFDDEDDKSFDVSIASNVANLPKLLTKIQKNGHFVEFLLLIWNVCCQGILASFHGSTSKFCDIYLCTFFALSEHYAGKDCQ